MTRTGIDRTFFREWTTACRQLQPLAPPSNLSCAPQPFVAGSRRWRHRLRLDEAVISSRGGATIFGLGELLSPSLHLPARVAPPPSRCCQSLTTGALAAGGQGSSQRRLPAWPPSRYLQGGSSRCAASPHFRTQNELPERCSKFSSAARCSQTPAAQETFLTGRRAHKSGWKCVLAQNRRASSRWFQKSRCDEPTL